MVRSLRKIILVYSAIKIRANWPPLYSVLKPETSSLSPSAWSNGARLVSAKHESSQIKTKGGAKKINIGAVVRARFNLKVLIINIRVNKVIVRVTSYEID